jgi:preprotein translocase subunit SecG
MLTLINIIIIIVCLLLIFIVLIQNPKGGGIASNFAASTQIMGVRKTGDVVEKATWILAVGVLVLCLSTNFMRPTPEDVDPTKSRIDDEINSTPMPTAPQLPPTGQDS